jgi:uncharacterized membrane protein YkoI
MWKTANPALLALAVSLFLTAAAAADDDDDDHDAARQAVESGEVLPLADILDGIQAQLPGRVLEVELEREDGIWVYELTILRGDGRRVEAYVNGATAEIISLDEN